MIYMHRDLLRGFQLFAALPEEELDHLLDIVHLVSMPKDCILCNEGEIGDRMYLILDGQVEVILALGREEERILSVLGPGEYFGEMSLLESGGIRTATVRTLSPIEIIEITRTDFDNLLDRWPKLAIDMLRELSLRLRNMEKATIQDLQEKNQKLAAAYNDLRAAQVQIIEKEKLEKELQVAQQIQMSMLPTSLPIVEGYEFGAAILPARVVGGDLFDFIHLRNGCIGIMIGDVSDKGVPAALFMALTRSLLRSQAELGLPPFEVLTNINRQLIEMNSSNMFVTMIYGVLSPTSGEFNYARAGHEIPLLLSPEGEFITISHSAGQIIGLFSNPVVDTQTIQISPGSELTLYTDGVTDAVNEDNQFFESYRLKDEICKFRHLTAQETTDQMLRSIQHFQGTFPQTDDITMVVIKRKD